MSWYCASETTWLRLQRIAAARDDLSRQAANTRVWNPKHNLVGVFGEAVYAAITGLPFNEEAKIRDGGCDFPGVDVKSTEHFRSPRLLRLATDPLKAPVYLLIAVDLARHRGRGVGYATREMLAAAPHHEYGYGPTRTLTEEQLLTADALVPRLFVRAQASIAA